MSDASEAAAAPQSIGRKVPHLSRAELTAVGLAERLRTPRGTQGAWTPALDRPDPVAILEAQAATRVPDLVPIRHGRMMASPFAFYRGAAAIMAADLAPQPRTALRVQLCGDAHLSNFGVYASPERTLLFDLNDFDETLPGPFEWDAKRLATSFMVAGRTLGWKRSVTVEAASRTMLAYATQMQHFATQGALATWYSRIAVEELRGLVAREARAGVERAITQATRRDHLAAVARTTVVVDGRRRFVDDPPLMIRSDDPAIEETLRDTFQAYRRTLAPDRRQLLDRFRFLDVARKVVGVGSVGTRCFVVLMQGADADDPLVLQVKEAQASVLEAYLGRPSQKHHGQRVVEGQRLVQAASDVFLGWVTGPRGIQYYWRQLWDAKWSPDIERARQTAVIPYAQLCGWALARAHARSGSAIAIAAYLGAGARFARATVEFAEAYAGQNERDYAAMITAVRDGRLAAQEGL